MSFFDAERFERLRKERGVTWGRPVRVHEHCTSTNDLALAAVLSEAKTGIVFLARKQSQGRGRRGNTWIAPAGECLMFSLLLRYPKDGAHLGGLSLAVGLALHDTVAPLLNSSHRVSIKWPNDLYVDDKKLAGVLVESKPDAQGHWGVVIGVGLNLKTRHFPAELPNATSLALLGADIECLEQLLVDALSYLEARIKQLLTHHVPSIARDVRALDFLNGRSLLVEGEQLQGAGIDDEGQLLVRDAEGQLRTVRAAHIELTE